MSRVRNITLTLIALLLLATCMYTLYQAITPPFTDQEIKASIVDTWQVEAIATLVTIGYLAAACVLSLALAYGTTSKITRRLAAVAVLLALIAVSGTLHNHIALTNRTTQLTAQPFGGFYGLP